MNFVDVQQSLAQPARLIARPFRRFVDWWLRELRSCVPEASVERFVNRHRTLVLTVDPEQVRLRIKDSDGTTTNILGGLDNVDAVDDVEKTVIELRPGCALRRMAYLPADAEERLADVLGYELDRLTPFTPDKVYYDFRISDRRSRRGFIGVELVASPRSIVDDLRKTLDSARLDVSCIRFDDPVEQGPSPWPDQNLLPQSLRARMKPTGQITGVLTVLIAALSIAAVALPLLDQQQQIRSLAGELETIDPQAQEADRIRNEVRTVAAQNRFFYEKRVGSPLKVQVLDELTQVLPDDTWLVRLEVSGLTLRIHGESANASALISLIEDSDYLAAAEFASPLTKSPRSGRDRFVIEATLEIWEDE